MFKKAACNNWLNKTRIVIRFCELTIIQEALLWFSTFAMKKHVRAHAPHKRKWINGKEAAIFAGCGIIVKHSQGVASLPTLICQQQNGTHFAPPYTQLN
jgi:hypothetical protein